MNSFQIDDIANDITSNRTILIVLLIILIIFFLITIGFIYYPVYLMKQRVQTVSLQSTAALASLKTAAVEAESTINGLNSGIAEITTLNNAVESFIDLACDQSPFINDIFCINNKS